VTGGNRFGVVGNSEMVTACRRDISIDRVKLRNQTGIFLKPMVKIGNTME